ncbi:hypothetical protein [Yokenella regensburgei]|uniref:hypothetical protein n=1 Tax=Yokenella regensburgei TaxID=158877 RepID=UPI001432BD1F|nr:hypothetical protein [Yokenella regensburgei]QIU89434.1 hypothetical protein HEC60_08970 [Yokenella regensburgei]
MSAPLPGAGYLPPWQPCGTKEEVLTMLREHVKNGCKGVNETREERMERKMLDLHASEVWRANTFAGPGFVAIGPHLPSRTDDRLKVYRGRFGHTRSD